MVSGYSSASRSPCPIVGLAGSSLSMPMRRIPLAVVSLQGCRSRLPRAADVRQRVTPRNRPGESAAVLKLLGYTGRPLFHLQVGCRRPQRAATRHAHSRRWPGTLRFRAEPGEHARSDAAQCRPFETAATATSSARGLAGWPAEGSDSRDPEADFGKMIHDSPKHLIVALDCDLIRVARDE